MSLGRYKDLRWVNSVLSKEIERKAKENLELRALILSAPGSSAEKMPLPPLPPPAASKSPATTSTSASPVERTKPKKKKGEETS